MAAKSSATLTQVWQGCAARYFPADRSFWTGMRLIVVTAVALLALAAPALGEVRTVAEVHTPDRGDRTAFPVIDAHAGDVAWSDYDAAIDGWRLMANVDGVTQALPVAARATPFDVDLGPDRRGRLVAVYSRCARGLRRARGCRAARRTRRAARASAISSVTCGPAVTAWMATTSRSPLSFGR